MFNDSVLVQMAMELSENINYIAEILDDNVAQYVQPNENREWKNLKARMVAGVTLPPGITGSSANEDSEPIVISWRTDGLYIVAWKIILEHIIQPAVEFFEQTDPNSEGFDIWVEKIDSQIVALSNFLVEFCKASGSMPASINQLFAPIIFVLKK